jgi:hypothetical protein
MRTSCDLSFANLFAGLMYGLTVFGKKHGNTLAEIKGLGIDASERFSGDGPLFELGCYMSFRIEQWLLQNAPERRERVSTAFAREFLPLFAEALHADTLPPVYAQRLSGFRQLARSGADVKQYHFHLRQLILRSREDARPEEYHFETAAVVLTDAFEDMGLMMELGAWETHMLPVAFGSLGYYMAHTTA